MSDPFTNPAWEGDARLPKHPAPAAAPSWGSSIGPSSADEKALEVEAAAPYAGAPYTAPTSAPMAGAPRAGLMERFDNIMPPHRRYMGRSRRTILFGVLGLVVLIFVLGLGLGLGLKKGGSSYVSLFDFAPPIGVYRMVLLTNTLLIVPHYPSQATQRHTLET